MRRSPAAGSASRSSAPTKAARRGSPRVTSSLTTACPALISGLNAHCAPGRRGEVGHCVHRLAMPRSRPGVLVRPKEWDARRSGDAAGAWREVSGNLPTALGFVIDGHAHEPETIYVGPIKSGSEH